MFGETGVSESDSRATDVRFLEGRVPGYKAAPQGGRPSEEVAVPVETKDRAHLSVDEGRVYWVLPAPAPWLDELPHDECPHEEPQHPNRQHRFRSMKREMKSIVTSRELATANRNVARMRCQREDETRIATSSCFGQEMNEGLRFCRFVEDFCSEDALKSRQCRIAEVQITYISVGKRRI